MRSLQEFTFNGGPHGVTSGTVRPWSSSGGNRGAPLAPRGGSRDGGAGGGTREPQPAKGFRLQGTGVFSLPPGCAAMGDMGDKWATNTSSRLTYEDARTGLKREISKIFRQNRTSFPPPASQQNRTSCPPPTSRQNRTSCPPPASRQNRTSCPPPASWQNRTSCPPPASRQNRTSCPPPASWQNRTSCPPPASRQNRTSCPPPASRQNRTWRIWNGWRI